MFFKRESTRALCVYEYFARLFTAEVIATDAVNRRTFSRAGRRNPEGNQDFTRIL